MMMIVIRPIRSTYRMKSIEELKSRCGSKRGRTKRNQTELETASKTDSMTLPILDGLAGSVWLNTCCGIDDTDTPTKKESINLMKAYQINNGLNDSLQDRSIQRYVSN